MLDIAFAAAVVCGTIILLGVAYVYISKRILAKEGQRD